MSDKEYNTSVDLYADRLYRFAYKNSGIAADAQDIVQMAYEKLWMERQKINLEKAKSWLFTVAYRLIVDDSRKKSRHLAIVKEDLGVLHTSKNGVVELTDPDQKKIIEDALNQLSPVQRSILLLRDYEGYNYEEIGELCALNASQVKVYLFRARQTMQKILSPYYKESYGNI